MAFTKIAAAGIGSTGTVTLQHVVVTGSVETPVITGAASTANVRANSLVVSGVSTLGSVVATTGTFSGNVSIAGTLTYEDVTNIDSIGVVTARTGINVLAGGINAVGVVTAFSGFSGNLTGNINSTGISTFSTLGVGTAVTISGGIVTATSFYGDGTNLTNTGSTLSAASGSQRVVLTGQTSGTMTSSATSASLAFNASTGALSATSFSGSGASLTSIPNSALTNSTISGVSLGSNLNTLTLNTSGTGLSGSTTYNGSGASTFTVTSNATSANTGSTIVARDASGNFSAGTITATLSGTATQVSNTLTLNTSGTGLSGSTTYNGSGASTFTVTSNATSANTANAIVSRDASGNFSAGTITATLSGSSSQLNGISAVNLFNNMGGGHTTRNSFDATTPSYDFGYRFVQGSTNGPGTGGGQFYSWYIGLGSDYPATGGGSYGAMFAVDRNITTPFLSVRFNESNSFSSWYRVYSGNGARAWVNFNGTNASIRASYNVSSVGRNGSGDYTINFVNALPDANYATFIKGSRGSLNTSLSVVSRLNDNVTAPTSSAVRILYGVPDSSRNLQGEDSVYINVSIFR